MDLRGLVSNIYSVVIYGRTDIFGSYDKIPVEKRPNLYAVVGVEKVSLENEFANKKQKNYSVSAQVNIKVLGNPRISIYELYEKLDSIVSGSVEKSGYFLKSIQISAPAMDKGLDMLVLEGTFVINGKSEVTL